MKLESSLFEDRIEQATRILESCDICPRVCGVNRLQGETGYCASGYALTISSFGPHYGEEPPLVGFGGSGTIFFTSCSLGCSFCQNYDISHLRHGTEVSGEELASTMLSLQDRGCHNINFVTPTHFTPQIMHAVHRAYERGLEVPLVYNCSGYESLQTLQLLEDIVDIYMPDIKFADTEVARQLCNAPNYPEVARAALREMHRQVGVLQVDSRGIAVKGLLVRHLVMPNDKAGTEDIMQFLAAELSTDTYVNIMDQYRPAHRAREYPEINRRITGDEYRRAIEYAQQCGLHREF